MDQGLWDLAKDGQARKANKIRSAESSYTIKVLDKDILVLPKVFYPAIDTVLLIKTVEVEATDVVLEPFSGTGAISIFISDRARKVVATDINPDAIENIRKNIQLHHKEDKVSAILANVFPDSTERFDLIVANPPYTNNPAKDMVERSMWDKNHEALRFFLANAPRHLSEKGRIFCSWSNFGDFDFFERTAREAGYTMQKSGEATKEWQIYRVYKLTCP
ncbi:MAG: methyltransferase [Candidatus Micrarchaeota archaeon]|nr:methyltransferase [Candidatus Micrarchaeota archaeon]